MYLKFKTCFFSAIMLLPLHIAHASTIQEPIDTGSRRAPHLGAAQSIGIPLILKEQQPVNLESPDTSTNSIHPDTIDVINADTVNLDAVDLDKQAKIQEQKSLEDALDNISIGDLGSRAKGGDSVAQYKFGMQYYIGKKVEKNIKTALYWIEKSASANYPPAMVQMGHFFESGEFGNVNIKKAGLYYKKAAEVEDIEGLFNLARLYDTGILGSGEDARRLAMGYYRKAANMGHAEALYQLAKFYNTKDDATRDMGQAVQLYRNSAHLGFAPAQLEVGILYEIGNFLPKDDASAAAWYTKAAMQGLATAQYLLAGMYLEGRGVEADIEKAIYLYEAAAKQDLIDAQFDLGILYITAEGKNFDKKKAIEWFQKAADNGDMNALDILQDIQRKK